MKRHALPVKTVNTTREDITKSKNFSYNQYECLGYSKVGVKLYAEIQKRD